MPARRSRFNRGRLRRAASAGAALLALPAAAAPADVEYGRDIRPILADHCFRCHGFDAAARQADLRLDDRDAAVADRRGGPAIVPGDAAASALLARVTSADGDERMPPPTAGTPLTDAQIDLLRRWIDGGAEYAAHWAFTPPARPAPPTTPEAHFTWPRTPIDRFIQARLAAEGIAPAPPADRRTLLRRVTLDLTGLPPTPDEVAAFINDPHADAYERAVDRLLASPHYGERWARVWLDLARYADTKGYEKDARRTIWPYRDWVIRALNDDMPFDRFTIEQLAGDLLDDPTQEQVVATAFHRNTMTNDEGGTDDEEFRAAAVVDRVNTTMQVWMGLTMGCAQCHDHKYDPISQHDYYRLYAFFNTTQDRDTPNEAPLVSLVTAEQTAERERIAAALADVERRVTATLDGYDYVEPAADSAAMAPPAPGPARDHVWIDDALPAGALPGGAEGARSWHWVERGADDGPPVYRGARATTRTAGDAISQHFFTGAAAPLEIDAGDTLFGYVFVDPANPPRQIMFQWHAARGGWEHRAYWGESKFAHGVEDTPSPRRMGDVPTGGAWVRLEVDAQHVGLAPGDRVDGWAFTQFGGTVHWDYAGRRGERPPDERFLYAQHAWEEQVRAEAKPSVPGPVRAVVRRPRAERSDADRAAVRRYYLEHVHAGTRARMSALAAERAALEAERSAIDRAVVRIPVMREQPADARRETHVHVRGSFLSPGDRVEPGLPAAFPDPAPGAFEPTRRGLARWLVDDANPLTARVHVNRVWEHLFGTGLVETGEDFGTQGALPSHPALLDWLATEFVRQGWSMKALCRTIVTSATYRQSSAARPELAAIDPRNRLLARGPGFRLEAEMIRDQALAVSGLLNRAMYGPPVFPPQPDGLWMVVYSGERWTTDAGDNRYRRGLYTFWRRTSPYPSMTTFDAPSREFCVSRRIRTNTPLQALVTLNDPVFVEAAQALARRIAGAPGDTVEARVAFAVEQCLARPARAAEIATLAELYRGELAHYQANRDAALAMATDPLGPLAEGVEPAPIAAWTVVANVILNLDEFLTKGQARVDPAPDPFFDARLDPLLAQAQSITRRHFLRRCQVGLGSIALASLLDDSLMAGAAAGDAALEPLAPRPPHFAPKAKHVIFLHMAGSPPQQDLFEYKPKLNELNGQPCPDAFLENERFAFIKGHPTILGSPYAFEQRGPAGVWVSELLPHLREVMDELVVVRSMHTEQFNHAPAQLFLYTGAPRLGRPSLGSWVTYGLGTDSRNLPGFVVLVSGNKTPSAGKSVWGSGFLPSVYQGVQCRTSGDPVLYTSNPAGMNRAGRRRSLDALRDINEQRLAEHGDPETLTRIAQYELAFRMQMSVPEVMDIAREPDAVRAQYGAEPGASSFANNCLLARRLVERGVRFVQLFDWGWDTHGTAPTDDIVTQLPKKCRQTDRPIAALITDLKQRGLLDETLVVWGGEFGRTAMNEARNGSKYLGRDHHPHCFTMWMAGGGVKRGAVVGATDELGYRIVDTPIHVHDLQATIMHLLGLDHERLTYRYQGRDFRLTDVFGNVAHELLA